jgi:hypothetical protein
MKTIIYVPRVVTIPDAELPRLAKLAATARRRGKGVHSFRKVSEWPITLDELLEQARRVGLLCAKDFSFNMDDDRYWFKGKLVASADVPWDKVLLEQK